MLLKTALIGVASTALLGTLVFGRDAVSYVKTIGHTAREAIKSEVPIEFEIKRARDMVENLVPDIRNCMHVIAEEEVDVEHLQKEIASAEAGLGQQKAQILARRMEIDQGRPTYLHASHNYSANDLKRDLACRFERFKTAESTVASKKMILTAREKSVVAAREKLENMLADKRDLEVQIESLEARMKTIQAAQSATSNFNLDNSQLVRAKKLIGELNKQLDVAQRVLDAEGKFTSLIPTETVTPVPEDLSAQIDEYFGRGSKSAETMEKSVANRNGL